MKLQKTSSIMAIATMLVGGFSACSDDEQTLSQKETLNLAKTPDFVIYSGQTTFSTTFGTRATRAANVNGNLWYQDWERPTNVTDEERAAVIEEFSKVRVGAKNSLQVTWKNFWVQQVYKGETAYVDGFGQDTGVASDKMNHLLVYNASLLEEIWWPTHEVVLGGYEHINNFNSGNNTTVYTDDVTHEQYVGTTLMVGMTTDGRDEQFGYHNSIDSKNHYEYIILKVGDAYYVGFDFYATHPEGQDANKNMDVERDWVFNDWIVKISPAQPLEGERESEELTEPEEPQPGEGGEEPAADEFDFYEYPHVEVNLSVNDPKEQDDYIATKLSVHIRAVTDVEVFIPVPAEYYCEADDMDIVLSHQLGMEAYIPQPTTTTYNINGHEVSAVVTFEAEGIRLTTHGMTAELQEYLQTTYGDGLTFEVWNYYNETATREGLKPYWDASTVTFTAQPPYYVNAFAKLNDGKNASDCIVTPPAEYAVFKEHKGDATHHGDYNVIYNK